MLYPYLLPAILLLTAGIYFLGLRRAERIAAIAGGLRQLHSLPSHYGVFAGLCCLLPGVLVLGVWMACEEQVITAMVASALPEAMRNLPASELSLVINEIKNVAYGGFTASGDNASVAMAATQYLDHLYGTRNMVVFAALLVGALPGWWALGRISKDLRARNLVEGTLRIVLVCCAVVAILTTVGIVLSIVFEAILFFRSVPLSDFLFGLQWSPQIAMRADQVGSSGAFGAVPVFVGTFLIAGIAMVVAIPIGLLAAIYLSEYAAPAFRNWAKPALELLAGIPTVVFGFFAALTVAPAIRDLGAMVGLSVASESALAAGLIMGIMIIPFVSSLSDDVIHAVPQSLRDGSLALGATQFETIRFVLIPAALPGIVGSILLAVSRAVGETMIVVMAAGLAANLTFNPLEAVTTVTVQIVTLLVGDQEFDSPKTLAAFALGLLLFVFTLVLNYIALRVVRRYREHYE